MLIPIYQHKNDAHTRFDSILSYLPKGDVHLASFKTPEFINEEKNHELVFDSSIRNIINYMPEIDIQIMPGLTFKSGTCFFSENSKTLGLMRHVHLPKTNLPTITIGKKVFNGNDNVMFNFFRKNAPPDINLTEDFVLRFNSSALPHEVAVPDDTQSIWLFIVLEHCGDIDLEQVREFYDCKATYDYYG